MDTASAAAAALAGEEEVEIIEPSPTDFNPSRMPRTVGSNAFVKVVEQAYCSRVLISKLIEKGDAKVEELRNLEEEREEGESEDEEASEIQKDLLEDVEQMKQKVKEHFNLSHKIGCMANFIVKSRPEIAIQGDKIKEEAQAALDKCEKDEVETEEKVNQWKKNNRKWLKRKRKDRGKEKVEVSTGGENSGGAKDRLVEKLCGDLKPNCLLSDDGNLQAKNTWRKAMEKYTGYPRECADITPTLYYDLFANLCDADMQKKLENIKGIQIMSEKLFSKQSHLYPQSAST